MKIKKSNKKSVVIAVIVLLLCVSAAIGAYFIYANSNQPKETKTQDGKTAISDSNVPIANSNKSEDKSDGIHSTKEVENNPNRTPTGKPTAPVGTFVSNHYPNLSGSPRPNSMASTCTTTPGATCKIVFTKGNVAKELTGKATDSNGNTEWTWTLQSIGITEGTWKIKAVASNGTLVSSAEDSINLEVNP